MAEATVAQAESIALLTAIQMEQVGQDFYRSLAAGVGDARLARLCLTLLNAEIEHERKFKVIRSQLAGQGKSAMLAAEQTAAARASVKAAAAPTPDAVCKAVAAGGLADLLKLAIQMERDSVRYYAGLPLTPVTQAIIREEQQHERALAVELNSLGRVHITG